MSGIRNLASTREMHGLISFFLAWIMGLGSARLERCRGWMELRELDDMATGIAEDTLLDDEDTVAGVEPPPAPFPFPFWPRGNSPCPQPPPWAS